PYVITIVEHHKLIFVGYDAAYVDTHRLYFFFGGRSTVQKDVFQGRSIFFFTGAGVYGRPAENGVYHSVIRMDINPLGRGNLMIGSAITNHVDKPIFG